MNPFVDRMIRAAKLDAHLYEEVEADESAMGQAMAVVVLSSVAAGVGWLEGGGLLGVVFGTISALAGWYIWAWMTYLIGVKLLPEPQTQSNLGELLRTTGFSSSPGILRILGVIPGVAPFVFAVAAIWMLVAMIIAVRQALDYHGTLRAVAVCVVGWIIQAAILAGLMLLSGGAPKSD